MGGHSGRPFHRVRRELMGEPRFLFLAPDISGSSGGMAVIYYCVDLLRAAGVEAHVVHQTRKGGYWDAAASSQLLYTYSLRRVHALRQTALRALRDAYWIANDWLGGGQNAPMLVKDEDILVVPEFLLSLAQEAFPGSRKIVFVQNPFSYLMAYDDARQRQLDPDDGVVLTIGVSKNCGEALQVTGVTSIAHVPVGPDFETFDFGSVKRNQIAYMPRKRRAEARIVVEALRRRGNIAGFELVEVDRQPQASVAKVFSESMFFMSFMKQESLGFPAMEAMAAGCVVVGYTGIGGREYFDAETGVPVTEDDTAALVRAMEGAVAKFRANPHAFEGLRRRAADRVKRRYARSLTSGALVSALRGAGLLPHTADKAPPQEAN